MICWFTFPLQTRARTKHFASNSEINIPSTFAKIILRPVYRTIRHGTAPEPEDHFVFCSFWHSLWSVPFFHVRTRPLLGIRDRNIFVCSLLKAHYHIRGSFRMADGRKVTWVFHFTGRTSPIFFTAERVALDERCFFF